MKPSRSLPSVARSRRFQQALSRRLQVLDHDLAAALDEDVEALHRTRVASRRLREVLPVIEARGAAARIRRSRGRVRRLTRALGGVREMDVALGILDEIEAARPESRCVLAVARADVLRERAVRYAEMIRTLADIKPAGLARDLAAIGQNVPGPSGSDQRRRLRERVVRRSQRLDAAIDQAGALYAFDRLHLVRIAAKKLRYALELVQELTPLGTRRLVARLKQFQDLLGRLHDLEVVAAYVRRATGSPGDEAAAKALEMIERETRQLHARYLGDATVLRAVAAAARDEIGPRLRTVGRRKAR